MTTEKDSNYADPEERPEVHGVDDPGRQPKTGDPMPEERGEQGPDTSPGSPADVSDGDNEHADMCERDEVLCPAVPHAGAPADASDAAGRAPEPAREASSLIVDMNLLDVRIRIETILQDKAKYCWVDHPLVERNEYAKLYDSGHSTFDIARLFCDDCGFSPDLCHDIYKERNQLC